MNTLLNTLEYMCDLWLLDDDVDVKKPSLCTHSSRMHSQDMFAVIISFFVDYQA